MRDNLPPIIVEWLNQMNNPNNSKAIRFNYFQMLNNVRTEVTKDLTKSTGYFGVDIQGNSQKSK